MEPNNFQNPIQSQNNNIQNDEPDFKENLFCDRSFEEVEDGYIDDRGFYTTPNGSFWDDDHNYFNHFGFDRFGGRYDQYGIYHPGNGYDENTGLYKEQKEFITGDLKEAEKNIGMSISKLKDQEKNDEITIKKYEKLEEESEDSDNEDKSNITFDENDIKEAYDCVMENENNNGNIMNNNINQINNNINLNGF